MCISCALTEIGGTLAICKYNWSHCAKRKGVDFEIIHMCVKTYASDVWQIRGFLNNDKFTMVFACASFYTNAFAMTQQSAANGASTVTECPMFQMLMCNSDMRSILDTALHGRHKTHKKRCSEGKVDSHYLHGAHIRKHELQHEE